MTTATKNSKRDRLIDHGQTLAVEHGVHPDRVPGAVDQVLDWHPTKSERANEGMLNDCLDQVLAGEPSAVDAIVPIDLFQQPGSLWTREMSDQLVNTLIEKGFDESYIRVCRFLSVVHIHFRLSGSAEEAKAEAIEVVKAAIEDSGKRVWLPHVEVKVVLPESPPAFCV